MRRFCALILCFVVAAFSTEIEVDEEEKVQVEFHVPDREIPLEILKNASIAGPEEVEPNASSEKEQKKSTNENGSSLNETVTNDDLVTAEDLPVKEKKTKVECELIEREQTTVNMVNSTTLMQRLVPVSKESENNETEARPCSIVLFYSPRCIFTAKMAPHYNALPRVFPDIEFFAVDVSESSQLYIKFGLVYVPNVMLFHNGKPFARFNETLLNLDTFVKFINIKTGLQHKGTLNVTSADMVGPLPSIVQKRIDYWLVLAWLFTIGCCALGFARSASCRRMAEFLRNSWHEANAVQHQHED